MQNLSGTTNDLTLGVTYNPASQIASTTRSNDLYAWTSAANRNDASAINGLNQTTSVGAGSITYDVRGNLNSTGSNSYTYSSENLLLTGPLSATLTYDPLLRLYQEQGSATPTTRLQYDGQAIIGEYDSYATLQKRYVHGPGGDEPLVEYDKSGGIYIRAWHHADERGSVIAQSDDTGSSTATNTYDEYGVPGLGNTGRFGYTGQTWLSSLGIWNYKARMYSSRLGRFMQTDPIGYGDGLNWYGYVGGDPVNRVDSSGLAAAFVPDAIHPLDPPQGDIVVNGDGCFFYNGCYHSTADIPFYSPEALVTLRTFEFAEGAGPEPQMEQVSCVQDNKAYHDQQVAAEARTFQANGYSVIFNVYFPVATAGSDGKMRIGAPAIADFVAFKPESHIRNEDWRRRLFGQSTHGAST